MPVHSSAMSTPRSFQGSCAGSLTRGDLDRAVADADGVALDRHLAGEAAVHGVEAQQVRVGLDRAEIVDGDDLDVLAAGLDDGAQHVAADAAEPVDGDPDGHSPTPRFAAVMPAPASAIICGSALARQA